MQKISEKKNCSGTVGFCTSRAETERLAGVFEEAVEVIFLSVK